MTKVTVKVAFIYGDSYLSSSEDNVTLTDDDVQIAASTLAYGLIEDMWDVVGREDEEDFRENSFRGEITEDFRTGRLQVVNGWIVEVVDGEATPVRDLYSGWFGKVEE